MFKLVNKQGKQIKVGDKVTNFRGEVRTVQEIHPPHKPSSSGHITTEGGFHYVTVYGLQFIEEEYLVEHQEDGVYQSVFPSSQSEHSQLHSTIDDAVKHIKSVNPKAKVTI